ncbi:MAG: 23S rRNA (uracil(1939)-C(5))-methyltransferase RlmD [Firmicutes bacterium]|nr:23S rRNA (uracil(1939)-C(5))-methyltransferase RlmD [Bacillota bacterium]
MGNGARRALAAGQRYRARVEDLDTGGDGVSRIHNVVVFVEGAVPGDEAVVEITGVRDRYARGRLVQLLVASPDRVEPPCPVADACGGCQLQALAYGAQLRWKRRRVEAALSRIGGLAGVPVADVLGMRDPWRYRNKAQYPVAMAGERLSMGFYRRGTHEVVDGPDCLIQDPVNADVAKLVRSLLIRHRVPVYDETTGRGTIRHVVVRASRSRREAMVVLVTNGERLPARDEIVRALAADPRVVSIAQNINPHRTNVIFGEQTRILWGKEHLEDRIGPLRFLISPRSFFQVNSEQAEVLYEEVRRASGLCGSETVLDAYCGVGTIGLYLASSAREVVGIEAVPEAVKDARRNARHNGIENARFYEGAVEEVLPRLVSSGRRFEVAILDPPRRGCEPEVLAALAAAEVPRLVYVSCHPETMARDLKRLRGLGYDTERVQPVDMFPMTAHVECVATVIRRPQGENRTNGDAEGQGNGDAVCEGVRR